MKHSQRSLYLNKSPPDVHLNMNWQVSNSLCTVSLNLTPFQKQCRVWPCSSLSRIFRFPATRSTSVKISSIFWSVLTWYLSPELVLRPPGLWGVTSEGARRPARVGGGWWGVEREGRWVLSSRLDESWEISLLRAKFLGKVCAFALWKMIGGSSSSSCKSSSPLCMELFLVEVEEGIREPWRDGFRDPGLERHADWVWGGWSLSFRSCLIWFSAWPWE